MIFELSIRSYLPINVIFLSKLLVKACTISIRIINEIPNLGRDGEDPLGKRGNGDWGKCRVLNPTR